MKKNPIHFYWGRKNGLVVTHEDAEGNHPEVIFVSNQLSLDKLRKTGVILLAGLFLFWRISRLVHRIARRHHKKEN